MPHVTAILGQSLLYLVPQEMQSAFLWHSDGFLPQCLSPRVQVIEIDSKHTKYMHSFQTKAQAAVCTKPDSP